MEIISRVIYDNLLYKIPYYMFKLEQRHVHLVVIYRIYLVFFINAWGKAHDKNNQSDIR